MIESIARSPRFIILFGSQNSSLSLYLVFRMNLDVKAMGFSVFVSCNAV